MPRVIEMNVEGHVRITKQKIRYLGVQVDNCRRFGTHSEIVCGCHHGSIEIAAAQCERFHRLYEEAPLWYLGVGGALCGACMSKDNKEEKE